MKQKLLRAVSFLFLFLLIVSAAGCGSREETKADEGEPEGEEYTIGVVVFSQDSPEMNMFKNYYQNYLEEGFSVKFYFSGDINSPEEENEFIRSMKDRGAQGIISFYGLDVESTVQVCQEEEMYYILGSGTLDDSEFAAVEENPWFLGTVGPDPAVEYQAGKDMAVSFASQEGPDSFLIPTGGASSGNYMHNSRAQGMLDGLQEVYGFSYKDSVEDLTSSDSVTTVETGTDVSITLSPGYMSQEEGQENLEQTLAQGEYDVLMCAYNVDDMWEQIDAKEAEQGADIQVGAVDCFSEENFSAFQEKDAYGNSKLNYIEGKYASMAGPAFAALYNAMSGHPEANAKEGEAIRLYQGFWQAKNQEEYEELYGYTQGIYENAYDCESLMDVIYVFNQDTSPEALKELTEAYTVEDVKERIQNR